MARAGFCEACGHEVVLTPDGSCPQGHGPGQITGLHDVAGSGEPPGAAPASSPVQQVQASLASRPTKEKRDRRWNPAVIAGVIAAVIAGLYFAFSLLGPMLSGGSGDPLAATDKAAQKTACLAQQLTIDQAVLTWDTSHGGHPPSLEALVKDGVLGALPVCPSGGVYRYDPATGAVSCSVHGGD